jgi:hypothetical protein
MALLCLRRKQAAATDGAWHPAGAVQRRNGLPLRRNMVRGYGTTTRCRAKLAKNLCFVHCII